MDFPIYNFPVVFVLLTLTFCYCNGTALFSTTRSKRSAFLITNVTRSSLPCIHSSNSCSGDKPMCLLSIHHGRMKSECVDSCSDSDDSDDSVETCNGLPLDKCCCENQACVDNVIASAPISVVRPFSCPYCHGDDCEDVGLCMFNCQIKLHSSKHNNIPFTSYCSTSPCDDNNYASECCRSEECVQMAIHRFSGTNGIGCPTLNAPAVNGQTNETLYFMNCQGTDCGIYIKDGHIHGHCEQDSLSCKVNIMQKYKHGHCCSDNDCVLLIAHLYNLVVVNVTNTLPPSLLSTTSSSVTTSTTPNNPDFRCSTCSNMLTSQCNKYDICNGVCMMMYSNDILSSSCVHTSVCEGIQAAYTNSPENTVYCCNTTYCTWQALLRFQTTNALTTKNPTSIASTSLSPSSTRANPYNFTVPSICADNDNYAYCNTAKEHICSAKDYISMQFAYTVCAKTCNLCHEPFRCPSCAKEYDPLICQRNLTICDETHVGCYMTMRNDGIHAGCADKSQACEESNHFLCSLQPLPFEYSPLLSCSYCCAFENSSSCFSTIKNDTMKHLITNSPVSTSKNLSSAIGNPYHFTVPVVCADTDYYGYCKRIKEDHVCSATDYLSMQFAYNVCAKTCNKCHDTCPSCAKQYDPSICQRNLSTCDDTDVGCYMTLADDGIHAGCADKSQVCQESNHYLCSLRPLPFFSSPSLLCNYCCAYENSSSCFDILTNGNHIFGQKLGSSDILG